VLLVGTRPKRTVAITRLWAHVGEVDYRVPLLQWSTLLLYERYLLLRAAHWSARDSARRNLIIIYIVLEVRSSDSDACRVILVVVIVQQDAARLVSFDLLNVILAEFEEVVLQSVVHMDVVELLVQLLRRWAMALLLLTLN
jgi:hypothetical protein